MRLTLLLVTVVFLTACNNSSTVVQEDDTPVPTVAKPTPTEQVVEVVGSSLQSPLANPTAEIVESVARSPVALSTTKPVVKATETVQTPTPIPVVEITPIFSPTPAPSPSPTATFEPLSDKPIMGYVFGKPERLQGIDDNVIKS